MLELLTFGFSAIAAISAVCGVYVSLLALRQSRRAIHQSRLIREADQLTERAISITQDYHERKCHIDRLIAEDEQWQTRMNRLKQESQKSPELGNLIDESLGPVAQVASQPALLAEIQNIRGSQFNVHLARMLPDETKGYLQSPHRPSIYCIAPNQQIAQTTLLLPEIMSDIPVLVGDRTEGILHAQNCVSLGAKVIISRGGTLQMLRTELPEWIALVPIPLKLDIEAALASVSKRQAQSIAFVANEVFLDEGFECIEALKAQTDRTWHFFPIVGVDQMDDRFTIKTLTDVKSLNPDLLVADEGSAYLAELQGFSRNQIVRIQSAVDSIKQAVENAENIARAIKPYNR